MSLVLTSCSSQSQLKNDNLDKKISLNEKLLIGEVKNNEIIFKIDKNKFITQLNKELFLSDDVIDKLEVNIGYTLGDKEIKYYYLNLTSSKRNLNVVKYLFDREGKLFIDKSYNTEDYTYVDFYISCEGGSFCKPRLFLIDDTYSWSCREFLGCVIEESDKVNACKQSTIVF